MPTIEIMDVAIGTHVVNLRATKGTEELVIREATATVAENNIVKPAKFVID